MDYQREALNKILTSKFPETEFDIHLEEGILNIKWSGLPAEYHVFIETIHLSSIFNTLESEASGFSEFCAYETNKYPCKIRYSNKESKDVLNALYEVLLEELVENKDFSIKLIEKSLVNDKPSVLDYAIILNKTLQVRHLIDERFENRSRRFLNPNNLLLSKMEALGKTTDQNLMNHLERVVYTENFSRILKTIESAFRHMYFSDSSNLVLDNILNRKLSDVLLYKKVDYTSENLSVLSRFIKKNRGNKAVESILLRVPTSELDQPLFEIGETSLEYSSDLEKEIDRLLKRQTLRNSGGNLVSIENEIATASFEGQTIGSLNSFKGFTLDNIGKNQFIRRKFGDVEVALTDDLIVIRDGNKISTKKTSNSLEKKRLIKILEEG